MWDTMEWTGWKAVGRRHLVHEASRVLKTWPFDVVALLVSFVPIPFAARYVHRIPLTPCACRRLAIHALRRIGVDQNGDRLMWACTECRDVCIVCCRTGRVLQKWMACLPLAQRCYAYDQVALWGDQFSSLTQARWSRYDAISGTCTHAVSLETLESRLTFSTCLRRGIAYSRMPRDDVGREVVRVFSLSGGLDFLLYGPVMPDPNPVFCVTADQRVFAVARGWDDVLFQVLVYEMTADGGRCCWNSPVTVLRTVACGRVVASPETGYLYVFVWDGQCHVLDFWSGEFAGVCHPSAWIGSQLDFRNSRWLGETAVFQWREDEPWVDVFY